MSHQNPPDAARVSRIFFYILMFAILGWFTYMQFFGADERRLNVGIDEICSACPNNREGRCTDVALVEKYDNAVLENCILNVRRK